MRISLEEPTGMWVRGEDGQAVPLTFPAFVAAVEDGAVSPDDHVWSRIVTRSRWVRAGDMRLFQMLTTERRTALAVEEVIWPPPIKRDW